MVCDIKRNWLLGGYSAEYRYSRPCDPPTLSSLIHALLPLLHAHFHFVRDAARVVDCKGRNQFDQLLPSLSPPHRLPPPHRDEVFKVGGVIASSARGNDFEWSPFEATCSAEFKDFVDTHHIAHAFHVHRSSTLPEWLPWRLIGAAAPIRPHYFRLGLELFQSRFTVASFGYLPQVTDSLLIDASSDTIMIRLTTEQRRWRRSNPFTEKPLLAEVASALKSVVGEDLVERFERELVAAGRFS